MAEKDKTIIPKSGYIPKQKNMIGLVEKSSNFTDDTKKYLVNELNKKRGLNIDLKIKQDVKFFLEKISAKLKRQISKKDWLDKCFKVSG